MYSACVCVFRIFDLVLLMGCCSFFSAVACLFLELLAAAAVATAVPLWGWWILSV